MTRETIAIGAVGATLLVAHTARGTVPLKSAKVRGDTVEVGLICCSRLPVRESTRLPRCQRRVRYLEPMSPQEFELFAAQPAESRLETFRPGDIDLPEMCARGSLSPHGAVDRVDRVATSHIHARFWESLELGDHRPGPQPSRLLRCHVH